MCPQLFIVAQHCYKGVDIASVLLTLVLLEKCDCPLQRNACELKVKKAFLVSRTPHTSCLLPLSTYFSKDFSAQLPPLLFLSATKCNSFKVSALILFFLCLHYLLRFALFYWIPKCRDADDSQTSISSPKLLSTQIIDPF